MANIWNKQSVITPVQEYQLIYVILCLNKAI